MINIGTGQGFSIGEIANMVIQKTNPDLKVIADSNRVRPKSSEVKRLVCDATKLKSLNWEPENSFEEGIDKSIEWFGEHLEAYSKKTEVYSV